MTRVEEKNIFRASMRQDILCEDLKLNKTFPNEIVRFIQGFIPHCLKVNGERLQRRFCNPCCSQQIFPQA